MIYQENQQRGTYGKFNLKRYTTIISFASINISSKLRGEEGSSASATRKGSRKIARRADYMMVAQLGKKAELEIVYLETGRPNSSQDKRVRDHKKLIRFSKDSIDTTRNIKNLKKIFNQSSKRQNLTIFTINIAGTNKLLLFFIYS